MKNTYRSILAVVALAFLIVSTASVQAQFNYIVTNGTVTITKYTGPGGDVIIPSTINGLPVTSIGSEAFLSCDNVNNVTMSDSVITIGDYAFAWCISLRSTTIPNSVTSLGESLFRGCSSLTSVTLPKSVTVIPSGAFSLCSSLTGITIPNSVSSIGSDAFSACTSLTSITIPNSVTSIGDWAFSACTSLTSVTIPGSVATIRPLAFYGCSSLSDVVIGHGVSYIGGGAFQSCTVTTIKIPDSVATIEDGWEHDRGRCGAFADCTNLASVFIGDGVHHIGVYAFDGCTALTNVVLGRNVTNIGGSAFSGSTNLTGVYCQGNAPVVSLLGGGFSGHTNAVIYYLPGTVGWEATFDGRPTAPWMLPSPLILTTSPNFGIQTNAFGFRISWATNVPVVVEASTTLANPVWSPVSTNTLMDGWSYFRDAEWTNYPARFYRTRQW